MTCQWYKRQMWELVCMVKRAVTLLARPILLWENSNSSNDFFSFMDTYFILEDLFWCNIFSTKTSLSPLVNFTSRFLMRFLYRYVTLKQFRLMVIFKNWAYFVLFKELIWFNLFDFLQCHTYFFSYRILRTNRAENVY